ncbi:MAG: hypothetical protein ACTSPD_21550 [Promethearchaeota archaeon]
MSEYNLSSRILYIRNQQYFYGVGFGRVWALLLPGKDGGRTIGPASF